MLPGRSGAVGRSGSAGLARGSGALPHHEFPVVRTGSTVSSGAGTSGKTGPNSPDASGSTRPDQSGSDGPAAACLPLTGAAHQDPPPEPGTPPSLLNAHTLSHAPKSSHAGTISLPQTKNKQCSRNTTHPIARGSLAMMSWICARRSTPTAPAGLRGSGAGGVFQGVGKVGLGGWLGE